MKRLMFGLCIVAPLVAGCPPLSAARQMARGAAAKSSATQLYQFRCAGEMDLALSCYAPAFFEATPREQWKKTLADIQDARGKVTLWTFGPDQVTTEEDGVVVTLNVAVTYERATANEVLTLYLPFGSNDRAYKVIGHQITFADSAAPGRTGV